MSRGKAIEYIWLKVWNLHVLLMGSNRVDNIFNYLNDMLQISADDNRRFFYVNLDIQD